MARMMMGVATLALALNLAGPAMAKKAAAMKCPVCKMTLSTKKTKANPKMVKIGSKTYYCCDKCDMSKMAAGGATKKAK